MPFSLTQLHAFRAAATRGTFTAAAAELRMSQPAVSDLVRRLETELGTSLFVRGSRRLELTAAGEHLLPHAERALEAVAAGEAAVRSLRDVTGGTATFGLLRNANLYLRDGLVRRFHELHPKVRIRLIGQNSAETAEAVRSGRLEAGLVTLPVGDVASLEILPIVRDEIIYVSADPAHVAAPPTTFDLCNRETVLYDAHFALTDPMRRQLTERAQLEGLRLEPVMEVEYLGPALDLVAAGFGDSLAPRGAIATEIAPRGLHVTPLADPLFDTIALVRRRGHLLSPATREFARLAHMELIDSSRQTSATTQRLPGAATLDAFLA